MIPRSLKASPTGIEKAVNAFIGTGLTQEEFAKSLELCRTTISNFFKGKLIDRSGFFKICNGLGLNPNEIFEPISNLKINQIANLRRWIFNDHSQLVAWLEISNKSYIVFHINEDFREQISQEIFKSLSRSHIQNIQSDFVDLLSNYLRENQLPEKSLHSSEITEDIVNLSSWLQDIFETGWSTLEELFPQRNLNLTTNYRSRYLEDSKINRARMGKQIYLGKKLGESQSVALVVNLTSGIEQKINVLLQLHPIDKKYLPSGVQLLILDEDEKVFIKAQAREYDNWIQLQISGVHGENFSVEVALDNFSIIEYFVI